MVERNELAATASGQIRNCRPRLAIYSGHSCYPIVPEHKTTRFCAYYWKEFCTGSPSSLEARGSSPTSAGVKACAEGSCARLR